MTSAVRLGQRGLRRPPWTRLAGIVSAVFGVVVTTALIAWLRDRADIPNLSILYLLVVLSLASAFGRGPAVLAAFLAFLAFNFFFVEPIYTFHVADTSEMLALGVLLVTAMVTGQLTSALRARAREAEVREGEVAALYELSRLLGHEGPLEERLATACRWLTDLLGAAGCDVLLPDRAERLTVLASHGALAAGHAGADHVAGLAFSRDAPSASGRDLAEHRWVRPADPLQDDPRPWVDVLCLPLLAGERRLGVVRLVGYAAATGGSGREMRRLRTAVDLLAQAVERERLAAEATDAEVLRRADQAKSALLSSVSHDLRTPLASIKASATSLLSKEIDWHPAARQELLLTIDEEADRLTRFVSRLLDLSRVQGGATQPRLDWHVVEDVLVDVAGRLDPHGIRVRLALPDDLPAVKLDYVMVEQILINLVENGLKYSPDGAPVEVSAGVRSGELTIDVADRGPGVSPDERERIFEKFYRARGSAGAAAGSGIGLAIARGLAEAHGGAVAYAPRPGGGSVFSLSLPSASDRKDVAS